jgi:protoporphyrinogen oxidase|tara:strand:- start:65 stop:1312 length:1248 start_codon:yes stop_codon:yes gene_type:complete
MKTNQDKNIYIIGAGVSGLIAAQNLEQKGYVPTILEATGYIGGRVRTEIIDGWILDVGFQVLLDAYPMSKKYLNYVDLDLQRLSPGARIYTDNDSYIIGDPLRDISMLLPTLFSSIGSIRDKLKIFQLNLRLKNTPTSTLFNKKERTTLAYLQYLGFSDKIITQFFKPFFSGIFLECHLHTSSRMFEFIYKMFAEGFATLPKAGIGAIASQLAGQLKTTQIQLNNEVQKVTTDFITMASGDQYPYDVCIVATDPSSFLEGYSVKNRWKTCDTLYFSVPINNVPPPIIHLSALSDTLINNIFYPTSVQQAPYPHLQLLSVTVVKQHSFSSEVLVSQVMGELEKYFSIIKAKFIKHYAIQRALPDLRSVLYEPDLDLMTYADKILLCGDHTANGSLNAAMISGERASHGALYRLKTN